MLKLFCPDLRAATLSKERENRTFTIHLQTIKEHNATIKHLLNQDRNCPLTIGVITFPSLHPLLSLKKEVSVLENEGMGIVLSSQTVIAHMKSLKKQLMKFWHN